MMFSALVNVHAARRDVKVEPSSLHPYSDMANRDGSCIYP